METIAKRLIDIDEKNFAVLFTYSLEHLEKKDKVRFYYALKGRDGKSGIVKSLKINHLGRAVLLAPIASDSELQEFFDVWACPFKRKEVIIKKE